MSIRETRNTHQIICDNIKENLDLFVDNIIQNYESDKILRQILLQEYKDYVFKYHSYFNLEMYINGKDSYIKTLTGYIRNVEINEDENLKEKLKLVISECLD